MCRPPHHPIIPRRTRARIACILLLAFTAPSLDAQPARDGLSARMNAFLAALEEYPRDTLLHFLPRRGEWTWVLTTGQGGRPERVGLWRFRRDDLLAAIEYPGPLCESFSPGGDAITLGTLMYNVREHPGRWRRVAGNRFVPPGASARSPVFVQWRREDGRWVLHAYGDERRTGPPLLGREVNSVVREPGPRRPPPPGEPLYAAGLPWYEERMPIIADGEMLTMYGPVRELDPALLERIGTINDVAVYVETGSRGSASVVYVPVSPGMYQPYQDMIGTGCP